MSYHGHRAEQLSKVGGQGQSLEQGDPKGAFGSPSEASFNEVYHERMKKIGGGTSGELKQFGSNSESEAQLGIPAGVEGQMKLKQMGAKALNESELKELGPGGGGKPALKDLGATEGREGHAIANKLEFGKTLEDAAYSKKVAEKLCELKQGGGESYGKKALENESGSWRGVVSGIEAGLGLALGPAGIPLMLDAQARMYRDSMSASKSGYGESNSIQRDMIQRGKMLKSWKPSDE